MPFDAKFVVNFPPEPKGKDGNGTGDAQVLWVQAQGDVKLVAWSRPLLPGQSAPVDDDSG